VDERTPDQRLERSQEWPPGRLTAVIVTLGEITDGNREAVLALRVAPEQERFVSSVRNSLAEAAGVSG
jgi:cobalamin biosynthesis protein CobD/CbiB